MKFVMIDGKFINLDNVCWVIGGRDGGCLLEFVNGQRLVIDTDLSVVVALIEG